MAHIVVNLFSTAIQKQVGMTILLPDAAPAGPLPVVYQLHGLSDDHSTWARRTAIERYTQAYGLMVVCPEGGRSFYCDAATPAFGRWEAHILECIDWVDRHFRTDANRRAIGGLSMGGYGAMKLGLKYPDRFHSVAAHSGVLDVAASLADRRWLELPLIWGKAVPADDDCFALVARGGPFPALHFDCGIDDFLLDHNRRFHAHLQALGVPHTYHEHPGAHTWDYWDRHLPAALAHHAAVFAARGA